LETQSGRRWFSKEELADQESPHCGKKSTPVAMKMRFISVPRSAEALLGQSCFSVDPGVNETAGELQYEFVARKLQGISFLRVAAVGKRRAELRRFFAAGSMAKSLVA